jgi:hypothetical protein
MSYNNRKKKYIYHLQVYRDSKPIKAQIESTTTCIYIEDIHITYIDIKYIYNIYIQTHIYKYI